MKKVLALTLSAVLAFSLAACTSEPAPESSETPASESTAAPEESTAPEVETVVYGFPGTAARLNYVNDDGTYAGYEIEIVKALDERLEQYEFELFMAGEFSALTPGLDSDKFDMVGSNISWKQERADNYLYSDVSYFSTPYAIGVNPDNTDINAIEDLAGKNVLTITGTATANFLENYNTLNPDAQIIIDYIDAGAHEIISQVVSGRYDACIQNLADYAIAYEEHGYEMRIVEIPNAEEISLPDGFFLFQKGATELQAAVDAELLEMRNDGTLSELCLQFFTSDLVPMD